MSAPLVPLGDLCDVLDSRRKPVTKRDRVTGEFPYYGATGILDYVADYIFDEKLILIGEDGAKWGAGEKTAFAAEGKYWVNNHAHVIRAHRHKVLDEWIIYYLNFSDLSKFITGLTVPKLNQGRLCEIPIPIPPLSEQQRIVAILDEAFAGLAIATLNAEKNLKNARELFDSYLNSVLGQAGEGWIEKPLSELIDVTHGYAFDGKHFVDGVGEHPLLLTPGNFSETGTLVFNERNTKRFSGEVPANFLLDEGDVVVVMTDLSSRMKILGKPAFVNKNDILHNQRIGRVAFKSNDLFADYLYYFFRTRRFTDHIKDSATGTMVKHTAPKRILSSIICYPKAVTEQNRIALALDALEAKIETLETQYRTKIRDVSELKQSILQRAFSAELPTRPSRAIKEAAE